ncbi:hypothetical protein BHE74_00030709 [Ensete ventricosum]|nr:hypothetical protein BHE74_00030709 [Ensete ventricosum]RZR94429.1 hypothetical protein BHM03_00023116 [Ensete ventricosum]
MTTQMTTLWHIVQEYRLHVLLPHAKAFLPQFRLRKLSRFSPSIKCFSEIRCMCLEAPFVFGTIQDKSLCGVVVLRYSSTCAVAAHDSPSGKP